MARWNLITAWRAWKGDCSRRNIKHQRGRSPTSIAPPPFPPPEPEQEQEPHQEDEQQQLEAELATQFQTENTQPPQQQQQLPPFLMLEPEPSLYVPRGPRHQYPERPPPPPYTELQSAFLDNLTGEQQIWIALFVSDALDCIQELFQRRTGRDLCSNPGIESAIREGCLFAGKYVAMHNNSRRIMSRDELDWNLQEAGTRIHDAIVKTALLYRGGRRYELLKIIGYAALAFKMVASKMHEIASMPSEGGAATVAYISAVSDEAVKMICHRIKGGEWPPVENQWKETTWNF